MGTIMLYSNGEVIEVSDGMSQDQTATINNQGEVAWGNGYPDPNGIVLRTDEETREVTDWGRAPRLNIRQDIAFIRFHDDIGVFQQWLWNGEEFLRLSNDSLSNGGGVINDCAEVAWQIGSPPEKDVLLMRMIPGDGNRDGMVNVNDAEQLRNCLTGPKSAQETCLGPDTDADLDGDVDLGDFAILQQQLDNPEDFIAVLSCMTGPLTPKDDCTCRAMDMDFDRDIDLRDFALLQTAFSTAP